MQIDLELLAEHVTEYLELDERFWNEPEGSFEFMGERVYFTKYDDFFKLEVSDVEFELPRLG